MFYSSHDVELENYKHLEGKNPALFISGHSTEMVQKMLQAVAVHL